MPERKNGVDRRAHAAVAGLLLARRHATAREARGNLPPAMRARFKISLTHQILIGLVIGVLFGCWIHYGLGGRETVIAWTRVLSRVFLKLIKLIISPLIFATLVVGIAGAGHLKEVGRI